MRTTSLLLVLLALVVPVSPAQPRSSTATSAADDVRLLGSSIEEIHPVPFRAISRQRFRFEVRELAERAPALSRNELLVGLLRIIASLGPRNGHTGLFPGDPGNVRPLHLYPIRLYHFSDGLYVVDAADRSLAGNRVVAVAGVPVDRVLSLVEPLTPRDNAWNLRGMTPHYLLTAEVLAGLGITDGDGPATFTFERTDGQQLEATLAPIPAPRYADEFADPLHGHYPSVLPSASRPLYLANSAKALWVRTLAGGRAVYVGYNAVVPPAPAVLRRIEQLVRAPRARRVIVDVRLNGGGDNTTYAPLLGIFGSKRVNQRGRLYLLVGRATFSAAANFAAEVDRDTRATIVGEPTGGGVETYGDHVPVLLPSLGWYVYIAARYHERKRGPNDHRLAVGADIRVSLSSSQYFAGKDPVLERVLKGL